MQNKEESSPTKASGTTFVFMFKNYTDSLNTTVLLLQAPTSPCVLRGLVPFPFLLPMAVWCLLTTADTEFAIVAVKQDLWWGMWAPTLHVLFTSWLLPKVPEHEGKESLPHFVDGSWLVWHCYLPAFALVIKLPWLLCVLKWIKCCHKFCHKQKCSILMNWTCEWL